MSYILIDGYNLIGTAHDSLAKARDELIEILKKYSEITSHRITLVFDGWKDGSRNETITRAGNFTIIYSRIAETADQVIRRILSSSTISWIVVSSDRSIADFAAKRNFAAIGSDQFEARLYAAMQNENETGFPEVPTDERESGYKDYSVRRKGNPRKLSSRQKKNLEALKKL